jgi:hypothetical protein
VRQTCFWPAADICGIPSTAACTGLEKREPERDVHVARVQGQSLRCAVAACGRAQQQRRRRDRQCFAAASQIREPDAESWFRAWSELAEGVLAGAERSKAEGRRISALSAYLRASNCFRAAYTFFIGVPVERRVVEAYRRQRAAFEAAVDDAARGLANFDPL